MNNRRNLLIAPGAGALTAPLVLRKSGGYAPNVHQPRRAFTLVVAVWAALAMASAAAAEYPTKPIRLMVPSAAGGTPDILARLIASELTKQMAQQVVVDNRGGASGIIGYEAISKAAPDGYTLGYAAFPFITNPIMYLKLPYDTAKDFQPVVQQVSGTNVLTVTPALPVRSARELIEYARAQPGKLSYGSIGGGGSQQLSIELFKSMTGTQIVQVSYKGMQQAITDTIAGQVHIVCDNAPSILPQIRAGRLRAIGVTGLKRIQAAPDIPTVAEAGVPGYEMAPSSGYVFPARTPRDIVLRMNAEINKALMSPAISEKIVPAGLVIAGGTPEQFTEHLHRETAKWAGVIKTAGIKAD
jgi:tripartite-type tricarboxylate transporter receptor subunit TctC